MKTRNEAPTDLRPLDLIGQIDDATSAILHDIEHDTPGRATDTEIVAAMERALRELLALTDASGTC